MTHLKTVRYVSGAVWPVYDAVEDSWACLWLYSRQFGPSRIDDV